MTNYYTDTTGVASIQKVTPIIRAFFADLSREPIQDGDTSITLVMSTSLCEVTWDGIHHDLNAMIYALSIGDAKQQKTMSELEFVDTLSLLANHFKVSGNADLLNFIDHTDFEEAVELADLFFLASVFDDGHGLSLVEVETAFTCEKFRLYAFGGSTQVIGQHYAIHMDTNTIHNFAATLNCALASNDLHNAARIVHNHLNQLLVGVKKENERVRLKCGLMNLLTGHDSE